jgi:amino acid permease
VQKRSGRIGAGAEGHSTSLGSRHVDTIAIGGTLGTGLLLGSGGRLARTTPGDDA